ncbi:MAG: hypothetical protein QOF72_666 [Blastocatellia bacterium]|nr:hypothetical protein [Blastocatellia bacterium]
MNLRKRNRKILLMVASLLLLAALPITSFAQGRGRGQEKKLDRFVNGHDARDGRWDGRGAQYSRRTLIGNEMRHRRSNRIRNRDLERNDRFDNRGLRRRNLDNNQFLRSQRSRQWNRNRRLNRRNF